MSANSPLYYVLVAGGIASGSFTTVAAAQAAAAMIYPPNTPFVIVPSLNANSISFAAGAGAPQA